MVSSIMVYKPVFAEQRRGTIMVWAARRGSQFEAVRSKGNKNWRRGRDSNPRYPLRYVRFRGGSFQPLTHLSGKQLSAISIHLKLFAPAGSEEILQQLCASSCQHPSANLYFMVHAGVVQ